MEIVERMLRSYAEPGAETMTMSVHDALQAWQSGEITARRAMSLTGAADVLELYAFAESCDVQTRFELLPSESRVVEAIQLAVERQADAPQTFGPDAA